MFQRWRILLIMIILTYSRPSHVVKFRSWILHYWRPPHYWDPTIDRSVCSPPRCYVELDHEDIKSVLAMRLLGIEICWIRTKKILYTLNPMKFINGKLQQVGKSIPIHEEKSVKSFVDENYEKES